MKVNRCRIPNIVLICTFLQEKTHSNVLQKIQNREKSNIADLKRRKCNR
uniref:Uncharacterized protein n=1 Tax=Anguilla anguilla TaxID=7936 RepID=A0A0E9URM3_ANGAN